MKFTRSLLAYLFAPLLAVLLSCNLAAAGPSPTQGDIWQIDGIPDDGARPLAFEASQFEVWGKTKKGLSMLPGGKEGFIDLNGGNFGRDGGGVDSQDWRNARTTVSSEKGFPIRTIYVRVQDGVDYGDFGIKATGKTAIGTQTLKPTVVKNQGPKANGKTQYFAVSFHRPVEEATLTFYTRNETGGKKANGFQVEVLGVSQKVCPDDVKSAAAKKAAADHPKKAKAKSEKRANAKASKREAKHAEKRRESRKGGK